MTWLVEIEVRGDAVCVIERLSCRYTGLEPSDERDDVSPIVRHDEIEWSEDVDLCAR